MQAHPQIGPGKADPKRPRPSSLARRRRVSLAVALATALLALAIPAFAQAARGHVFASSFGAPGSGNGQLEEPAGIAVEEASGQVYVVDSKNDRVEIFDSAGTYLGQFDGAATPSGSFDGPAAIAIDNSCAAQQPPLEGLACEAFDPSYGDVYVVDGSHAVIDKFDSSGAFLTEIPRSPETLGAPFLLYQGLAVDGAGRLWVSEETGQEHQGVDSYTNEPVNQFSGFRAAAVDTFAFFGLAVDSATDLYLRGIFGHVGKFSAAGEVLIKPFGGEETLVTREGIATEALSDEVYLDAYETIARFKADGTPVERFGAGNLATEAQLGNNFSGALAVNARSGQVYVVNGAADRVARFALEPPSPPRIEATSASEITSDGAEISAEINPRSEPGEVATEYHFEYGRCAGAASCATSPFEVSVPIPDATLPPDFAVHAVSAQLEGLLAQSTYHYRVLASNSRSPEPTPGHREPTIGEERTFTTQGPGGPLLLPDARQWELVSPPDKHGATILPIGVQWTIQAAADGRAIAYATTAPTEAQPEGNSNLDHVISVRTAGGWRSLDLAVPHELPTGAAIGNQGEEYRVFSADLSRSVVQPFGAFVPSLSADATEETPYLRTDFPAGEPGDFCEGSCFAPLVSAANVPEGRIFAGQGECRAVICGPEFLGADPGLDGVVLNSQKVGLTAQPGDRGGIYLWSGGDLRLLSVLPNGKPPVGGSSLGYFSGNRISRNAISGDGSRVFWSEQSGGRHLFLRYNAAEEQSVVEAGRCSEPTKACTVQLDAIQGGSGTGAAKPIFQGASADGSVALFSDEQRLTEDSGASAGHADLYRCRFAVREGALACELTDLTPAGPGGEPANLVNMVSAISADSSRIYFVAAGDLDGAGPATAADCSPGVAGTTCNLYLYDAAAGTTTLLAALSGADQGDWGFGGIQGALTARTSSDGRYLAFMSQRSLTGYDNRDAKSGESDLEVYLYDADGNGGQGSLACASCNPTGARPRGTRYSELGWNIGSPVGGNHVWESGQWLAANVPGWTISEEIDSQRQSRYLSDSGRLFFNSADSLVPQDSNGTWDVYEFEPPGVGGCNASQPSFDPKSGGCVSLISSGTSARQSGFLEASASGEDVFFLTYSQLSPLDPDTSIDVYDAHVCSVALPCPPPPAAANPECGGDTCQLPARPPQSQTPASLSYSGPGNQRPAKGNQRPAKAKCPKGKVRQKGKCVKQAPKRSKKGKKHNKSERADANRGGAK